MTKAVEQFCHWCGKELYGKRSHARFCDSSCRAEATRFRQNPAGTAEKALESAQDGRAGIRSGNVRSVEEAGALHDIHKAEWERRILRRIKWALDTKGEYHADDCADIPVPAPHVNLIGVQVMRLKNRGVVVRVEDRRNSSKASNSRPSGVYRYAKGGPEKLTELAGLDGTESPGEATPPAVESGEHVGAGQAMGKRDQGCRLSSPSAGTDAPDQLHTGALPASSPYSPENA